MPFDPAKRRRINGFTLVELIVTIVIVSIVFTIGGWLFGRAFETYDLSEKLTSVDWQGRIALERMAREMRMIRSSGDLTISASTSPIFFSDTRGATVCFCYESVSGTLRRGTSVSPNCGSGGVGPTVNCGATGTQPLADNVAASGLNFYYYTTTGTVAASAAQVDSIAMSLLVTKGTVTQTHRLTVNPREL